MKSTEEFRLYQEKEIKPIVESLEAKRLGIANSFSYKKYWRNLKWMAAIATVLTISIEVFPSIVPEQLRGAIPLTILYAMFAPLYIFIKRNWGFEPINQEYKQKVIPKFISFFGSTLTYSAKDGITIREFNYSDLVTRPSGFEAEDLVAGTVDGIEVRLSDVKCLQSNSSNNSNSNASGGHNSSIIFYGLYAVSKLNKNIPSRVILKANHIVNNTVSDIASTFLGNALVGKIHEQLETNILTTGDTAFDHLYTVKCADEGVARKVLTPTLIQLVMAFQKEIKVPVDFSFFDNEVHMALHGVNLFEGDAHKSFTEKDISSEYFGYINMIIGVAEAAQK